MDYILRKIIASCVFHALVAQMLDQIDQRLLLELQRDASQTSGQLSERLNLSTSQVGRRRLRLETDGYVRSYHARVDPAQLGLTVQAFVQVQTGQQTADTHKEIMRMVDTQPQITAAWTLTGDADYMLRVFCSDLSDLNRLIQDVLLPHTHVSRVTSQIVMDQIKRDAPLPV